ncbi:MAG: NAD(P)-binding protein [Eubacteriales bacterium]|nr:NAD(P)-binding protein [Eubacteriales bacterium]
MRDLVIETPGRDQKVLNTLYRDTQRRVGASPPGLCPVDMTLNFLRMSHAQTCGKCVPCRIGLRQLTKMLEQVLNGEAQLFDINIIENTARTIADTADCAIGYEAATMVLEAVIGFRKDFESHITAGRCNYGLEQAIPCTEVCPAHVDVPGYISLVKAGRNEDAVKLIRKDNPFPAVCGYVCEHPCEKHCRRMMVDDAVNICGIKRYAVDHAGDIPVPACAPDTGKRVGVVGGGPGGLTAAYFLRLMGHEVTVFEQRSKLGGMLRYGIPDYRLPQDVLDKDIQYILDTGVKVETDVTITDIDKLKASFDAVYISIGAHDDKKLGIEGENSEGVVSAVHMLRGVGEGNIPDLKGKRVCVIGGGNVAMDASRTSVRLGAAHVSCVYRRRIDDMTALAEEIEEAQAEGVEMLTLHAPDHIEADENGHVSALWAQPQIISRIDSSGRTGVRKAAKDPVRIPCDLIIVAIGQAIHSAPFESSGIETYRGAITAESSSFVPGSGNVFAGGDAVSGPATVIRAVAAGKVAAGNIDQFFGFDHKILVDVEIPNPQLTNSPACGRVNLTGHHSDDLVGDFALVSVGMSEEEAHQECGRCLRCDHFGYGIFRGGRRTEW